MLSSINILIAKQKSASNWKTIQQWLQLLLRDLPGRLEEGCGKCEQGTEFAWSNIKFFPHIFYYWAMLKWSASRVWNIHLILSKEKDGVQNILTFHVEYPASAPRCTQWLLHKERAFIVLFMFSVPCKRRPVNLNNTIKQIKLFIYSEINRQAELK